MGSKQEAQGQPVALDDYDPGLINDHGGGDVGWWQDYIRSEIQSANEHWRAQIELRADSAVPEGFRIFRSPHEGDTDIRLAMELGEGGYMSAWLSEGGRDDDDTVGQLAYRLADALLSAQPAEQQPAPDVAVPVEALEEISDPIRFMKEMLEEGEQLNGMAAIQLAEDASYLRGIARAALATYRKGGDQ
ncbi:MAG TPA: hypothetical protein VKY62_10560 [Devosia sp.]|nr:hypothetical protein [Devosia sp.]